MVEIEILTLANKQEWENYISKLPIENQDIYFTPFYYSLYENLGDGKAECFVYKENNNLVIFPYLINNINELGFELDKNYFDIQGAYGYNGIIASNFSQSLINNFHSKFNEYCTEKGIITQFLRYHPILNNQNLENKTTQLIFDRKTIYIDLRMSYDDIFKNSYSSQVRNTVRKAHKLGYTSKVIENPTEKDILAFKEVYYKSMTAVNASKYYFFNDDYFENLIKNNSNIYLINIINKEDEIACVSLFLHFGEYFHYHLSGRNDNSDNSVNNMIIDEAVKLAQQKKAQYFHLGGGRTNAPDDSLLKYKEKFSKNTGDFFIGKKIYNKEVYLEVIKQWEEKYPEKISLNQNILLRYRN